MRGKFKVTNIASVGKAVKRTQKFLENDIKFDTLSQFLWFQVVKEPIYFVHMI